MTAACVVGATGLVGSYILSNLKLCPEITRVHAFTRKDVPTQLDNKVVYIQDSNSDAWPGKYPKDTSIFFSALGTVAGKVGGFANQRKIDYDLNIALAKAAQRGSATTFVLISTAGASSSSVFPYTKMKGELDEAVKSLGFKHIIILKPGLLVGSRDDSRPFEFAMRKVARLLGSINSNILKDTWAQDAEVVAAAAVNAALQAIDGTNTEKVRVLAQTDIVRLGRM